MTGLGSRATLTKPQYLASWDLCLKICVMVLLLRFSGVKKKYFTSQFVSHIRSKEIALLTLIKIIFFTIFLKLFFSSNGQQVSIMKMYNFEEHLKKRKDIYHSILGDKRKQRHWDKALTQLNRLKEDSQTSDNSL